MTRLDKGEITWITSSRRHFRSGPCESKTETDKVLVIDVLSDSAEGYKVHLQWHIITPAQTHNADSDVPFNQPDFFLLHSQRIRYAPGELAVHTSRPGSWQIRDEMYERTLERIEQAKKRVPPFFTMRCSSFQPTSG